MREKRFLTGILAAMDINRFDLLILAFLFIAGALYLHDPLHWGIGWIGDTQYGDAGFWWNGALHVAQGIFQDNPGKGFRPGYFVLTGLTLPVLGTQFQQYYPYFLLAFLMTASLFYLALRQTLNRWVAACVVAMLILNPFTAEWLATSTTDGTGLLLSLAALACMILGIHKRLHGGWLIAFSILFALTTLTRPLVTPFIVLVLLAILFLSREPVKKRLMISLCILLAFCLPTAAWMAFQKVTIDRWALSSNDASAFYAASDPNIQVWNNGMYTHIQQLGAKRYHVKPADIDGRILNQIFWEETVKNYFKYPKYHLLRILPHFWEISRFSPKMAAQGTNVWQRALLSLSAWGLALWLFWAGRKSRALLLLLLGFGLYKLPLLISCMTLAGALIALIKRGKNNQLGMFLLALYWITGVTALYFVGGTWGPPSFSALFTLNALGYRLGSQVFFVGDLLAAYFLLSVAFFKLNPQAAEIMKSSRRAGSWYQLWHAPSKAAGSVVLLSGIAFLSALIFVFFTGGQSVFERVKLRSQAVMQPYPQISQMNNWYKRRTGKPLVFLPNKNGRISPSVLSSNPDRDLVFTGVVSDFIWNMAGQERAQFMVYAQNQVQPYTMGPGFVILEAPQHLAIKDWSGKQGAFIIRQFPDKHNNSNVAYYLTVPALHAFVPLSSDGQRFALDKARWFPLVKNASHLDSARELQNKNVKLAWAQNSGQEKFQRRLFISSANKDKKPINAYLILDVRSAHGPSRLSFSYAGENNKEASQGSAQNEYYDLEISTLKKGVTTYEKKLFSHEQYPLSGKEASLKKIELPISSDIQTVKITFNRLQPDTGVWIYEFNWRAEDFASQKSKKL